MSNYPDQIAIWKKKDKNGDTYLSVCIERNGKKEWINVFANKYHTEGDTKPHFKAKLGQDKGTYQSNNGGKNPTNGGAEVKDWSFPKEEKPADDEVPF